MALGRVLYCDASRSVHLSSRKLLGNFRGARRGGAPGPSGMRNEHLKVILEDQLASNDFARMCNLLANACIPESIKTAVCLCLMTALRKDSAGLSQPHGSSARVRGFAVGDVCRTLVGRTLAQQFHKELVLH